MSKRRSKAFPVSSVRCLSSMSAFLYGITVRLDSTALDRLRTSGEVEEIEEEGYVEAYQTLVQYAKSILFIFSRRTLCGDSRVSGKHKSSVGLVQCSSIPFHLHVSWEGRRGCR